MGNFNLERLGLLGRGFKGDFVVVVVVIKCAESVRKMIILWKIDIFRKRFTWKSWGF